MENAKKAEEIKEIVAEALPELKEQTVAETKEMSEVKMRKKDDVVDHEVIDTVPYSWNAVIKTTEVIRNRQSRKRHI